MQECLNSKGAWSSFDTGTPCIMQLLGSGVVTKAKWEDRIQGNLKNCELNISSVFEALFAMFSRVLPYRACSNFLFFVHVLFMWFDLQL